MQFTDDLDGGDFKPFFDMAIGVLFILLILIGSLLFFQTADKATESTSAQNSARERQAQIAAYLQWLADHLRAQGLMAEVDRTNSAIIVPLGQLATIGGDGLPVLQSQATKDLGRVLAHDLACIAPAAELSESCNSFPQLHLDEAAAEVRTGEIATGASLRPDRFGTLLTDELSAAVVEASPDLLRLSGRDGGALWKVRSALGTGRPAASQTVGGDFAIGLKFTAP
jgi:hypothetical protein